MCRCVRAFNYLGKSNHANQAFPDVSVAIAVAIVRAKGPTLCTRTRASFENSREALYAALFNHEELLKDMLP